MKTLYVLRHAKSSWENHNQTDFERPLNERGLLAAPKMGKLMRAKSFAPDLIVSSPAARAKQTAEMVRDTAQFNVKIRFNAQIYEATVGDLLEVLCDISEKTENLLLVGHNPGLENLVRNLTGEIRDMPTAALAEIELKVVKWKEIYPACGKLRNLFKPKEIAD
ncbi:MAG: histidine phosphatase family protein [Pyrinomonadaceae bacterium]